MDHDDAPIGTVFSRRQVLTSSARLGLGILVAGSGYRLSDAAQTQGREAQLIASPEMAVGPFFVDEKLNRSDIRGDMKRPEIANGHPMLLELTVLKLVDGKYLPFKDAQVDLWCADAEGEYSGVDDPQNSRSSKGQSWLRGFQRTDSKGLAKFTSIVPGWYPGRTPHLHVKVRKFSETQNLTADFSSQLFFTDEAIAKAYARPGYAHRKTPNRTNATDGLFQRKLEDGTVAGEHLVMKYRSNDRLDRATFTLVLTDQNFNEEPAEWLQHFDWRTF